ncbi:glycine receptor subunit alpha-4-like isoform X2 [Argopecten irradians]
MESKDVMELKEEHPDVDGTVHKDPPRTVYIQAEFVKLSDIDTVKEQFAADVFLHARWREKSLDHSKEGIEVDSDKYWNPDLVIRNRTESAQRKKWCVLWFNSSGEAFIVEKRRIKGVFTEKMELQDFPFDSQNLSVVLTSDRSVKEVILEEDSEFLSTIDVTNFADEQEWCLKDYVESDKTTKIVNQYTDQKNVEFPVLRVSCFATRQFMFFVWNIIIIMLIISLLSFATFAIDRNLPQNRLQLAFTLTLTGVTFRFVANQSLPKIPYLTKLDMFILFSMIFNFLVSVWHAAVSLIDDTTAADGRHDFWAFIAFIILYSLFQCIFIIIVFVWYFKTKQKIKGKVAIYRENSIKIKGKTWYSNRQRSKTARTETRRVVPIPEATDVC